MVAIWSGRLVPVISDVCNPAGDFDEAQFKEHACQAVVKMIEIKLSQGAKPGHGGILPAVKLTQEIADIRHVPMGQDVVSPAAHTAFSSPAAYSSL